MVELPIIGIVQGRSCGDLDQQDTAGPQQAGHLAQRTRIVLDMLEHVQRDDRVKHSGRQRAVRDVELQERHARLLDSDLPQRFGRHFRTDDGCLGEGRLQVPDEIAVGAADFENALRVTLERRLQAGDRVVARGDVDRVHARRLALVQARQFVVPALEVFAVGQERHDLAGDREMTIVPDGDLTSRQSWPLRFRHLRN